jgi:hypothetical protein
MLADGQVLIVLFAISTSPDLTFTIIFLHNFSNGNSIGLQFGLTNHRISAQQKALTL